jgi:hypothetical protein
MALADFLDGFRSKKGRLSYWRIANGLFEPRGLYLGRRLKIIDRLNTARSVIGALMLLGIAISYQHNLVTVVTIQTPDGPRQVIESGPGDQPGIWLGNIVTSMVVGVGIAAAVGVLVVAFSRRGRRASAALQLCWPLGTVVLFAGFLGLFAYAAGKLDPMLNHMSGLPKFAFAVGVLILVVPIFKSLYLVATGLFRADDGHPLLAPIAVPVAAWYLWWHPIMPDNSEGIPHTISVISAIAGPATLTALSAYTILRLQHDFPNEFPFRDGPVFNK